MLAHQGALHRKEGAGPDVQANGLHINAFTLYGIKHVLSEMEPCRRRRYRAFDMGVQGLVSLQVYLLSLPVQIRRDGHPAAQVEHSREAQITVPIEAHACRLAIPFNKRSPEIQRLESIQIHL